MDTTTGDSTFVRWEVTAGFGLMGGDYIARTVSIGRQWLRRYMYGDLFQGE